MPKILIVEDDPNNIEILHDLLTDEGYDLVIAKNREDAVQLAAASRPHQAGAPDFVNELASWGAGTRAAQFLVLGGKARALLQGRAHVTVEDIQALAAPVLRHRILLNYRAEAEGMRPETVITRLLEHVKSPLAR